jgi:hypothetical protein
MARKNPAAVALGRRGGKANTAAQRAARALGPRNGGRPRKKLPCIRCRKLTTERDASRRADCGCGR